MEERKDLSADRKDESKEAAIERFKQAMNDDDAVAVAACLDRHPFLKEAIDEPWFSFDSPAIVAAASRGNRALVDALLERGASPNAKSGWWAGGFGTLHHDHDDMARYLIGRGARVDMHAAAALGLMDELAAMTGEDAEAVNRRGPDGQVPLHFARTRETIDFLLGHGAQIDIRDIDHGSTPAQWAVDQPDKCAYLIERGAEPDIFMACMIGDAELAERLVAADPDCVRSEVGRGRFTSGDSDGGHIYLYKIGASARPLFAAERANSRAVSDVLLRHCTKAEHLLLACWRADRDAVRELLADDPRLVAALTAEEAAVIGIAAWESRTDAVRVMLEAGFDPDARRCTPSMTALHRAAMRGNAELVRLLLEHGASVGLKNEYGGTALGSCAWGSLHFRDPQGHYPEVARLLIRAGIQIPEEAGGSETVASVMREHGAK